MFNKVLIEDYLRLIHNSGSIGTVTLRHIGSAFVFFGVLGVSYVGGSGGGGYFKQSFRTKALFSLFVSSL